MSLELEGEKKPIAGQKKPLCAVEEAEPEPSLGKMVLILSGKSGAAKDRMFADFEDRQKWKLS